MIVTDVREARTTTTPAGTMTTLAAPSQGSAELSSWRVRMQAGAEGPVHVIDREQVMTPLAGAFAVTIDGDTAVVTDGQTVVLPAGAVRQIRVADGPAEALVCMAVGGRAVVPGNEERHRLPWAE